MRNRAASSASSVWGLCCARPSLRRPGTSVGTRTPYAGRPRRETAEVFERLDGYVAVPDLAAPCKRYRAFKLEARPPDGTAAAQELAETRHAVEVRAARPERGQPWAGGREDAVAGSSAVATDYPRTGARERGSPATAIVPTAAAVIAPMLLACLGVSLRQM